MAGLTYDTYVSTIAELIPTPTSDANFQAILPSVINDAEQRLYRELDLLDTSTRNSSAALTAGNRNFNEPSNGVDGPFLVTDEINVITPAGTVDPDAGTRVPLIPATEEMMNMLFPTASYSGVPQFFAMFNQNSVIVGPAPNANYQVEVIGTVRPAAISTSNITTLLSVYFPDCFVAASMVFVAGYMHNFGAAVDDPKMAVTWESHLQALMKSAETEEARKNFAGPAWSGKSPTPLATPPRT